MSVLVLTSNHLRHKFVATTVARHLDVALVLVEPKRQDLVDDSIDTWEARLLSTYFGERSSTEETFFSKANPEFEELRSLGRIRNLERGGINDPSVAQQAKISGASLGLVFGTSIIKPPLLTSIPMINIHLGISPYYRGSGTNFWAMHNGDFHLVGATIHAVTPKVDAGAIFAHVTTPVSREDTPHTLGCRVIQQAAEKAVEVMRAVDEGSARGQSQWPVANERLYRNRDFTPQVLSSFLEAWPRLVEDYFKREADLKRSVTLVTP